MYNKQTKLGSLTWKKQEQKIDGFLLMCVILGEWVNVAVKGFEAASGGKVH